MPRALLLELKRYKDTVRCAEIGAVDHWTLSTTTDANLDYAFVEKALFSTPLRDYEKSTEYN